MRILIVHNDYGRFSGEEQAIEDIAKVLSVNGHEIDWFRYPGPNSNYSTVQKDSRLFYRNLQLQIQRTDKDRTVKEKIRYRSNTKSLSVYITLDTSCLQRAQHPDCHALPQLPSILPKRPAPLPR